MENSMVEYAEQIVESVSQKQEDYLSRQEFVCQLQKIIGYLSDNKSCATFAIDGVWGSGKTFVLDMLEKSIREQNEQVEETAFDRYFLFHYNCWQYDYYEEPLIAIVSSMLDAINNSLLSASTKEKTKGVLKRVGKCITTAFTKHIENKTGIPFTEIIDNCELVIKDGIEDGRQAVEAQNEYDIYFTFKKIISQLQQQIKEIADTQTVVIVVDELDRCLPEYAIKVLERLHHLTEGMANVIVVLAIDKTQLQESVKKAFGFEHTEQYLRKFIKFYVKLDTGAFSECFIEKYPEYISLFEKGHCIDENIDDFSAAVFQDIDNRERQQIMEKTILIHNMLFSNSIPKDYTFMCMEILLMVVINHYGDTSIGNEICTRNNIDTPFDICTNKLPPSFLSFFYSKYNQYHNKLTPTMFSEIPSLIFHRKNIASILYFYWVRLHNDYLEKDDTDTHILNGRSNGSIFYVYCSEDEDVLEKNITDLKKFIEFIEIIK